MGEEEKKVEETKKVEEGEKKVEKKKADPADGEKKEDKKPEAEQTPPPPPPPQEIVLKVFMHCEGCARKVRRCLKGFEGVEDVITDCKTSKVVVKGEKADPLKVQERVQRKSHRQVDLISPIPKPPEEKPQEKEPVVVKPEEKKEEIPVVTVVLGVYMHCEACAQEIKKRIQRMKGVESAEPDLKGSQVTVKGAFEPEKLTEFVNKRTGKHAVIVKVEPEKKEVEAEKGKDEKKAEEGAKEVKKVEEGGSGKEKKEGGDGGGGEPAAAAAAPKAEGEAEETKLELKKNELYYYHPQNYQVYPPRFVQDMYAYPPQIFSDENPNACSVM